MFIQGDSNSDSRPSRLRPRMWTYCIDLTDGRDGPDAHHDLANTPSTSSRLLPFVSGKINANRIPPSKARVVYNQKVPYLVRTSVKLRKDIDTIKFVNQLVNVAAALPVLRAHRGQISEFMVHGMGPIPGAKNTRYKTKPTIGIHAYGVGQ